MWKITQLFPDPEMMLQKWEIFPEQGMVLSRQQKGKDIGVLSKKNGRVYVSYVDKKNKKHILKRSHIIYYFAHKRMPEWKTMVIDHQDKIRDNDRIENLNAKTISQNRDNTNKRTGCSSKYKGVSLDRRTGMWMTKVRMKNKTYHCERYDDEVEAAKAYDMMYFKLKKTVLGMNFPELLQEYLQKMNSENTKA